MAEAPTVPETDWLAAAVPTVMTEALVLCNQAATEPDTFWVVGRFVMLTGVNPITEAPTSILDGLALTTDVMRIPVCSDCTVPETLWFGVDEVKIEPPTITTGAWPTTEAPTVPETD